MPGEIDKSPQLPMTSHEGLARCAVCGRQGNLSWLVPPTYSRKWGEHRRVATIGKRQPRLKIIVLPSEDLRFITSPMW